MDRHWSEPMRGDRDSPPAKKSGVCMPTVHRGRSARTAAGVGVLVLALLFSGCGNSAQDKKAQASQALDAALKLQASGQKDKARAKYQEVLDAEPTNKYAIYNLALLDQLDGKNDSAEGKYRVVIKLDPLFEPALYNLAVLVAPSGRTVEAIDLYRRAIGARPAAAEAHFNLALLLRFQGKKAEGNAEMIKALALNPKLKDPAAKGPTSKPSPAPAATPTSSPTG